MKGFFATKKKKKIDFKDKERLDFEKFVRKQLLKLKQRGLSLPVVTL